MHDDDFFNRVVDVLNKMMQGSRTHGKHTPISRITEREGEKKKREPFSEFSREGNDLLLTCLLSGAEEEDINLNVEDGEDGKVVEISSPHYYVRYFVKADVKKIEHEVNNSVLTVRFIL